MFNQTNQSSQQYTEQKYIPQIYTNSDPLFIHYFQKDRKGIRAWIQRQKTREIMESLKKTQINS